MSEQRIDERDDQEIDQGTRTPDDVTDLLDQAPQPRSRTAARWGKSCLSVLIALAVIVGGGFFAWHKFSSFAAETLSTPDYTNAKGTKDIHFTVPSGAPLTTIGEDLQKDDVIKSTKAWKKAIAAYDGTPTVQAGTYRLRTQVPAATALSHLTHPATYRIRNTVQVLEGLRLSDQIAALAKGTKISVKSYDAALRKPQDLGLPPWAKNKPEGFLFPDTYELTDGATATSVLQQMTGRFTQVSDSIDLTQRAQALHVTPYQVVIVASIIEKEVNRPADRPKVARVIYNRLAKGMKLQLDSTVLYAVGKDGELTTSDAERASKSPYNTYVHAGLPPGPISAPGEAALKAAANPASGPWMYWVVVNPNTGETVFSTTKTQHDAAVIKFQQWCTAHKGKC
ncbi:ABC transporter substrate-binding protein [Microlunatus endophyticus]|uniref:Endolytic murein transglycosylase n=1 Tax=Microlunatus endophyticus TaxID=1716077 RepID=A0A917W1W2_9ACTN|nr:endolytic transglycosylase MltG [Microlunatus endophyticus]GGL52939.1 ABC transporter substrate-binding protein [Microlunatus endophyticus]